MIYIDTAVQGLPTNPSSWILLILFVVKHAVIYGNRSLELCRCYVHQLDQAIDDLTGSNITAADLTAGMINYRIPMHVMTTSALYVCSATFL